MSSRTASGWSGKKANTCPASANSRTCRRRGSSGHPMGMIGQHLLNGLMQGTIYGLVAIGFTIFFGVMNVIKFSHGDVLTFGAFGALVTTWVATALGLPIWLELALVILVAVAASAAIGALIARSLVLPL